MAEPTTMGLGWYPDPTARHERRFFDGRRWTEHVADGAVLGLDRREPVPAPITSPATPSPATPSPARARPLSRSDLFEWTFKVSMIGLLVLFLVAARLHA